MKWGSESCGYWGMIYLRQREDNHKDSEKKRCCILEEDSQHFGWNETGRGLRRVYLGSNFKSLISVRSRESGECLYWRRRSAWHSAAVRWFKQQASTVSCFWWLGIQIEITMWAGFLCWWLDGICPKLSLVSDHVLAIFGICWVVALWLPSVHGNLSVCICVPTLPKISVVLDSESTRV